MEWSFEKTKVSLLIFVLSNEYKLEKDKFKQKIISKHCTLQFFGKFVFQIITLVESHL